MLASGLAMGHQDPVQYFRSSFADDLKLVARAADGPEHLASLSVASFCPDYPKDPMYSEPAHRFVGLREQRWFLSSLFVTQLACQASHSRGISYYYGPPTVLVGLLSSASSVMHPAFLLLVLALYREPVKAADTGTGLNAILEAQVQEMRSASALGSDGVVATMRAALQDHEVPTSLRAFVPDGDHDKYAPDLDAAGVWRKGLLEALSAAAANPRMQPTGRTGAEPRPGGALREPR